MVQIETQQLDDFVNGAVKLPMKFSVTLNDEDYTAFQTCLLLQGVTRQKLLFGLMISLLFIVGLSALFYFLNFNKIFIAVFFILAVAGKLYGFFNFHKLTEKKIKRHIENLKTQGDLPYEKHFTIEFSQDEWHGETQKRGTLNFKYPDIIRILQDDEHIYIMYSSLEAVMLPLRCLDNRENELLLFLSNKMIENYAMKEMENNE